MATYASYKNLGQDKDAPKPETMMKVPQITSQEHRASLINTNQVVVIDNYTDWCGPCKTVSPLFAQLAQRYQGKAVFAKENVEDGHGGAPKVRGVPCFHFYVNGQYIKDLTITGGNIERVKEALVKILGSSEGKHR